MSLRFTQIAQFVVSVCRCCSNELLEVFVNDYYCIWSSVMQRLKNILGSRKKGAQEPHAAREQRNDYQGYTTSNLKGTPPVPGNACLTQRVLAATVCARCSFSFSAATFPVFVKSCLSCCCCSFQRARFWCRMSPGAWAMWPSTWTPRTTLCNSSLLTNRYPAAVCQSLTDGGGQPIKKRHLCRVLVWLLFKAKAMYLLKTQKLLHAIKYHTVMSVGYYKAYIRLG